MNRLELPTVLLAALIYAGWAALTFWYSALPVWFVLPAGGLLVAWHGSLQHELIHGHPSPWPRVNALIGGVPLALWLPYGLYRRSHSAHHESPLTHPTADPESYYMDPNVWNALGSVGRIGYVFRQTFLGRCLLGPICVTLELWTAELRRVLRGDFSHVRDWAAHGLGVGAVFVWVVLVCGVPAHHYVLLFAAPGLALTLWRSFIEHSPTGSPSQTAVVESNWFWSLLFLNNNLHVAHHAEPGMPWYELGSHYARNASRYRERAGQHWYRGYADVWWRFGLRPKDPVSHPAVASSPTG